jgi:hypothetical protein
MLKRFAIVVAISTLGAGVAFAERAPGGAMDSPSGMESPRGMEPPRRMDSKGRGSTAGSTASEAVQPLDMIPPGVISLSTWQDKNIYDPAENKIGEIKDILIDRSGRIQAVIVSLGGFMSIGGKDVAIPFGAVSSTQRNNKTWLTMNATKDSLKNAKSYRFDRSNGNWTLSQVD